MSIIQSVKYVRTLLQGANCLIVLCVVRVYLSKASEGVTNPSFVWKVRKNVQRVVKARSGQVDLANVPVKYSKTTEAVSLLPPVLKFTEDLNCLFEVRQSPQPLTLIPPYDTKAIQPITAAKFITKAIKDF